MVPAAWAFPLILVTTFYVAWLLAWMKLGHAPRPSWEDPSETLGLVYWASCLPIILMPAAAIATLCSVVARLMLPVPRFAALTLSLMVAALWIASVALLRWDPIGVGTWWWD